jgi:hypothetical protein
MVGIPKTIDNDICVIDKSFGFETAVAVNKIILFKEFLKKNILGIPQSYRICLY